MGKILSVSRAMHLYSFATDMLSHRVRIVLGEKDIAAQIHYIRDEQGLPEDILHLNPYGAMPSLQDRDVVLYDSRVIIDYLDERYPHPPLMPIDPVSRAKARLVLYRIERDWFPLAEALEHGKPAEKTRARQALRDELTASAEIFTQQPYLFTSDFGVIDASVAPILWRLGRWAVKLPPSATPVVHYAQRLFEREAFIASLSPEEREMPPL